MAEGDVMVKFGTEEPSPRHKEFDLASRSEAARSLTGTLVHGNQSLVERSADLAGTKDSILENPHWEQEGGPDASSGAASVPVEHSAVGAFPARSVLQRSSERSLQDDGLNACQGHPPRNGNSKKTTKSGGKGGLNLSTDPPSPVGLELSRPSSDEGCSADSDTTDEVCGARASVQVLQHMSCIAVESFYELPIHRARPVILYVLISGK